ncbi:hypothetical protein [Parerythrobacter jejuensis]|uniref:hypothetical protein n=1 Tax=Parerythrobacter jejuensis TaxID=795812 RepID=UPI00136B27AD|nr:hypothetical protein [Parerythrobacter jejuensis]
MARIVLTVLAAFLLAASPATSAWAATCDVRQQAPPSTIGKQTWIDQAQFGFYVGNGINNRMALQSRFDRFVSFNELKFLAGRWRGEYDTGRRLASQLENMAADVDTLASICKRLDDAAFDETPFDYQRAERELRAIRSRINAIITPLVNYESSLGRYAGVMNAASQYYQGRAFPANRYMRIGPNPASVNSGINTLHARWRAILADFRTVYLGVTVSVDPAKDSDITNMATQAQTLSNLIGQTRAISRNLLPQVEFNRYATGDFIYDFCPIQEGRSYAIENTFQRGDKLSGLGNAVQTLDPKGMMWLIQEPVLRPHTRWKFTKNGNGFWKIQTEASVGTNHGLYTGPDTVVNLTKLRDNGTNLYSGQFWRCYGTEWSGTYRFSSSFSGEGKSIDLNRGQRNRSLGTTPVTMADTGAFGGQIWWIKPQ